MYFYLIDVRSVVATGFGERNRVQPFVQPNQYRCLCRGQLIPFAFGFVHIDIGFCIVVDLNIQRTSCGVVCKDFQFIRPFLGYIDARELQVGIILVVEVSHVATIGHAFQIFHFQVSV